VKGKVVALAAFDGEVVSLLGATPLDDEDEDELEELEDELLSFEGAVPDLGVSVVAGVGVVVVEGGGVEVLVVGGGVGVL
jgi:hypothetical protein